MSLRERKEKIHIFFFYRRLRDFFFFAWRHSLHIFFQAKIQIINFFTFLLLFSPHSLNLSALSRAILGFHSHSHPHDRRKTINILSKFRQLQECSIVEVNRLLLRFPSEAPFGPDMQLPDREKTLFPLPGHP